MTAGAGYKKRLVAARQATADAVGAALEAEKRMAEVAKDANELHLLYNELLDDYNDANATIHWYREQVEQLQYPPGSGDVPSPRRTPVREEDDEVADEEDVQGRWGTGQLTSL